MLDSIGSRITKARLFRNLNQKELAQMANITESSLSRYENEIREPKSSALISLAEALNVSTDYLLGITDDMEIKSISLGDKSDTEFEDICNETMKKFMSGNVMFNGEPASKEALEAILSNMKIGMACAFEEQRRKRNRNK